MNRRVVVPLVCILLGVPASSATWYVNGGWEPDTPDDLALQRTWTEPDQQTVGMKIYFNALPVDRNAVSTNVNVGLLHTRYLPAGQMGMTAWLGVWKDCNKDGYVGLAETAANEYRPELLLGSNICPVGSIWNRNNWVSEFIPIGPENNPGSSATFPRVIFDPDSRVWGDFGRPHVSNDVHFDCAQIPFPRGTFDSTGGLLVYADCQFGYNVARTINETSQRFGLGLGFDGDGGYYHPDRDCNNLLNQDLDTYGNAYCNDGDAGTLDGDGGSPAFTTYDCGSPLLDVRDPTANPDSRGGLSYVPGVNHPDTGGPIYIADENGTYNPGGNRLYFWSPVPTVGDVQGSYWEGYQRTVAPCQEDYNDNGPGENVLGASFSGTNPTDGKRLADFNMTFNAPAGLGNVLHSGYPSNAGIRPANGHWDSSVTYLPPPYLGPTVRNEDLQPAGGIWFTFYARVGEITIGRGAELRQTTPGIYGSEACGGHESGVRNGWDCDPSHWWNADLGGTNSPLGPRPGDHYQLRDVDCYDGSLADGSGFHASLALFSEDMPCKAMGTGPFG